MARKKKTTEESEGGFSKMLAGTVVLGIVFSAGLITGQRLLRAEARAPMVSLSTTRIAPEATVEDGESKPSLRTTFSFYEHLTGDAEASPPPAAPAAEEVVAAEPPAPAEAPAAEEPKPEAAPEAPKPEAQPEPKPAEPAPAAAPKPEEKPPAEPVTELLDEVVASIAGSPDDGPAALPARYTLQVSSHPDRNSAEREMGRLTQMGVEPHVVKVNVPGKGELWRVRVGKFHTMDEARDFQGSVKSTRGVAGFVTPL